jgi:hypothetical protein
VPAAVQAGQQIDVTVKADLTQQAVLAKAAK